jgi:hypothetical protein
VPFSQFELLRDAWCKQGNPIELAEHAGMNHVGALEAGTVPAVRWLADRFAGQPAPDTC